MTNQELREKIKDIVAEAFSNGMMFQGKDNLKNADAKAMKDKCVNLLVSLFSLQQKEMIGEIRKMILKDYPVKEDYKNLFNLANIAMNALYENLDKLALLTKEGEK